MSSVLSSCSFHCALIANMLCSSLQPSPMCCGRHCSISVTAATAASKEVKCQSDGIVLAALRVLICLVCMAWQG